MKKYMLGIVLLFVIGFSLGAGRYYPVIKTAKCTGCNECVAICPVNAITRVKEKAVIDPGKCIGCRICTEICSWGAAQ